jgi:hypothetical protein
MKHSEITKIVWEKYFPLGAFLVIAITLLQFKTNLIINLSNDSMSALLTVNGILLGFVSSIMSNILTISSSPIIQKMKESFTKKGMNRYDELIMIINNARFWNLLSLCGGMLLLLLPNTQPEDLVCYALKAVFLSLMIVSIFTFCLATSLVDKTLGNT